jgi:hypothetical protein
MKRGYLIGLGGLIVVAAASLTLINILTAPRGLDEAGAQALADKDWPVDIPEAELAKMSRVRFIAPHMT